MSITELATIMEPHLLIIATLGLVALTWYLFRGNRPLETNTSPQLTQDPVRFSDPATCNQIIACKGYNDTGASNLYTNVQSRAIPNQRLVAAFGIDNSFTTSEAERRKVFNAEARQKIKMTDFKVGNPLGKEHYSFFREPQVAT